MRLFAGTLFAIASLLFAGVGHAQVAQTRSDLESYIETNIFENTSMLITPTILRTALLNQAASTQTLSDPISPSMFLCNPTGSSAAPQSCGIDSSLRFSGSLLGVNPAATIIQNINTSWIGGWPGTGNLGVDINQTFTGSPTGSGLPFSGGNGLPLNLIDITSDQLLWTNAGGRQGLLIKDSYGGGSAGGDIMGLAIDVSQTGSMANGTNNYAGVQLFQSAFANVTGASSGSGNGLGTDFGLGINCARIQPNIWRHEVDCSEVDFSPVALSSSDYAELTKFVNFAPSGWTANLFQTFISFSTENGALSQHIITIGDPQSPSNGFPVSATGDILFAFAGTVQTAIDFSNLTTTDLLKGPNGFDIDNSGFVHSNKTILVSGSEWGVFNAAGQPLLDAEGGASLASFVRIFAQASGSGPVLIQAVSGGSGNDLNMAFQTANTQTGNFSFNDSNNVSAFKIQEVASALSEIVASDAASGNPVLLDVGGTATGISIGASAATAVNISRSGELTTIAGLLATTGLPTSGTATGSLCRDSSNHIFIKTTTGACL